MCSPFIEDGKFYLVDALLLNRRRYQGERYLHSLSIPWPGTALDSQNTKHPDAFTITLQR